MLTQQIRQLFLDFFHKYEHHILPSVNLVPENDDSVFFVNAGMAPLKNYFINPENAPALNLVSVQKCLRAGGKHNDLDNVGLTTRHHTLFEMLGNFSFGGYGAEHALYLAHKFLTQELKFDPKNLHYSTLPDDYASQELCKTICGIKDSQLFPDSGNTWSMGSHGPLGRCIEIYLKNDSGHLTELWNIVITDQMVHENGIITSLPRVCIDTGAGLERIAAAVQGKDSNYDNDVFTAIKQFTKNICSCQDNVALNVIADHVRAILFLSSENVMPSNTGRGYVMRSIMRRAFTFGYESNLNASHFKQLLPVIAELMSFYPELSNGIHAAELIIDAEYDRLMRVLNNNQKVINELINSDKSIITGEQAFYLHDTKGLPISVLIILMTKHNKTVDLEVFQQLCSERNIHA